MIPNPFRRKKPAGEKSALPLRARVFFIATAVLAGLLLLQYGRLMLAPPAGTAGNLLKFSRVERGPIVDRSGQILAVSTRQDSCTLWLPQVKDLEKEVGLLASALGLDRAELAQKITSGAKYQVIKRQLTQKESAAVRELLSQNRLPGVKLEQDFGRSYPEKSLAAGVIGYVGMDNVGLAGIEYTYNDILSPPPLGEKDEKRGAEVWLTLDSVLQYYGEQIAQDALAANKAARVNILVSEAQTGDLLVWASAPGFDANRFGEYDENQRSNVVLTRAYEPGSVFKIFSLSSLLDSGLLKTTDTFNCNGAYERTLSSGEVIRIKDLGSYGVLTMAGILRFSSNAGTGYASDLMDAPSFEERLRLYGFGSPTGISLIGETPGLLRPSSSWSARSKPTIAMGQEIGVSALQMVTAATVLANGGVMLKPQLVKKVVSSTGEVLAEGTRQELRPVIKPQTASQVLEMLKDTVDEGTGRRAKIEGIEIAGKTGTAQERDPRTGRYSEKNYIASMLVYIPADKPRYIVYVTIQDPMGESYLGGHVAAPIVKTMAEKIIQYSGLPKTGDRVVDQPGSIQLQVPPPLVVDKVMPNLKGLSKRALLPLLNRSDLRVEVKGEGWVVNQTPPAGTALTPGLNVTVELQ